MRTIHAIPKRILFALACAGATAAFAQPPAELGKREFDAKCAVCHGLDGKGRGPYAEQLRSPLPDLTTIARRNGGTYPAARIHETIEGAGKGHGTREMPVWGLDYTVQATQALPEMPVNQARYVKSRIEALVAYVGKLQAR